MKLSTSGISKLKALEDFSPVPYLDPPGNTDGKYSIGYGHQIQPTETSLKTATITVAKGVELMQKDVAPLETLLNRAKYTFNQNQFDSLVIFGYNTGGGALAKVIATWNNTHDDKLVTAQMALYTKITKGGKLVQFAPLEQRRLAEITLFKKPIMSGLLIALAVGVALYAFV